MEIEEAKRSVLVIGGGIAGISASLDLAEQGHHVYLVERTPSIGGRMAQLDKTFPTLDCSICILAPKMVEVLRHPNITLLTYSEVIECNKEVTEEGEFFKVGVLRKARYVNEDICIGCALCTTVCPQRASNEFEEGISNRAAIYIPFPQAVPLVATIDHTICRRFPRGICKACEKVCERGALNFEQEDRFEDIYVSSIIVATGFDLIDPEAVLAYGYGRFEDVITSLEFERFMSASGPTSGEILKPSDSKHPERIAFILCVGSRSVREGKKSYCSKICCLYSTKEAIITREHAPDTEVVIYYNDKRAIGRGHEEFFVRAADEFGVNYKIGLPSEVQRDPETGKLLIEHANLETGKLERELYDMVVLSPAIVPSSGTDKIAEILNIDLDEDGFIWTNPLNPIETSHPKIFAAGCARGPEDISTSVIQACAAAAAVAQPSAIEPFPIEVKEEKTPEELPVEEESRIGVFVCHCGIEIGGTVDVPSVAEYAKTLPDVVFAEDSLYACSQDAQEVIKKSIKENNLNRLVIASCTPRTHLPLFQETAAEAGLNPYLVAFASIRELDSWVHMQEPEAATQKAKDLVRMAVARARLLRPGKKLKTEILPVATVIGAGVSGMSATLTIADKGYQTYLIEKADEIGGFINQLHYLDFLKTRAEDLLSELGEKVRNHENITLFTNTEIKNIAGSIGNFELTLSDGKGTINSGVIILATGADYLTPEGYYHYGESSNIITQLDFSQMVRDHKIKDGEKIGMILCVGAREKEGRQYCSIVCCSQAIKDALLLKKDLPGTSVDILFRDIRVRDEGEKYFREARGAGVRFLNYSPDDPPKVQIMDDDSIQIKLHEQITRADIELKADKLVLVTPIVTDMKNNRRLSEMLKVPLDENGFFLEARVKLRPVDFATEGIFVCGTANGPKSVREAITQAEAAASRALVFLMKGIAEADPIIAEIDQSLCIGCANCVFACPFNAISITEDNLATVNPVSCKGCGVCSVECPAEAITMHHFTNDQIMAMVETALEEPAPLDEPRIVGLMCNWCCYAGADNAGVSRFQYPSNIRPIRVMCSGRVDPLIILRAFQLGADGVFVGGCHPGDCHYIEGNYHARDEMVRIKKLMEEIGIEPGRLRVESVSASEGKRFAELMKEFTEQIKELGAIKFRFPKELALAK